MLIVHHPLLGVYLGSLYGCPLWSRRTALAAAIHAAPGFTSEAGARDWLAGLGVRADAFQLVAVQSDLSQFASLEACAAAGLPPWVPADGVVAPGSLALDEPWLAG